MRVKSSRLILQRFVKEILIELFEPSFLHLRLCSGFVGFPVPLFVPPFQILPYPKGEAVNARRASPHFIKGTCQSITLLLNPRSLRRELTKAGNDTQTLPDHPAKG